MPLPSSELMKRKAKPQKKARAEGARHVEPLCVDDPYPMSVWLQPADIPYIRLFGSKYGWLMLQTSEGAVEAARTDFDRALSRIDKEYPPFESIRLSLESIFHMPIDLGSPEGTKAFAEQQEPVTLQNVERLFEFYGIPLDAPHAWQTLAWVLATRHVPGFNPVYASETSKSGGRPRGWTPIHLMVLYAYVQGELAKSPKTPLERIIRGIPKKVFAELPSCKPATLRPRYFEACKDRKIVSYVEAQVKAHGANWFERWANEEIMFDWDAIKLNEFPEFIPVTKAR